MPLVYLASPYSHPDVEVRIERFEAACRAAAHLMREGYHVFSPIAHSHSIALLGDLDPLAGAAWQAQDAPLLAACDEVWVLTLPGWYESKGVRHEMEHAYTARKRVRLMEPV